MTFQLRQDNDAWTLLDPRGEPFFTVGVNHIDETNLKYPHNHDVWKQRYGSRRSWIADGVVADLRDWGFNTIGWTQEYVSGSWGEALDWFGDPIDLGHSLPWSAADLISSGMPYVVQIRVSEIEDWNGHPWFPDVYSEEFDAYCEYLARSICVDHADSENLIGYFLVDIPAWLPHASGADFEVLRGLDERSRNIKLYDVAYRYYETITRHIRAADPRHLVLGDRYNGNKGIPNAVLTAMKHFVDVLSVQYFPEPTAEGREQMVRRLRAWHEYTGKPVLLADVGNWTPTTLSPHRTSDLESQAARAADYVAALEPLLDEPWFLGWHWCGYVENTARGWGLKDPWDEPYADLVGPIRELNSRATHVPRP